MAGSEVALSQEDAPPLTVGFGGHRRNKMSPEALSGIGPPLAEIFGALQKAANYEVCLVTSLADGSDLVAATVAIEMGIPVECVIPFGIDQFRSDLSPDEDTAAFDRAIRRAASLEIVTGSRDSMISRNDTYRRVAESIVRHSRLLIAVWDGMRADGPGGTAETVDLARSMRMPVIAIAAASPHHFRLTHTAEAEPKNLSALTMVRSILSELQKSSPPRIIAASS